MAKKFKQQGGWLLNPNNPNDRRGLKAKNLNILQNAIKVGVEDNLSIGEFVKRNKTLIDSIKIEAAASEIPSFPLIGIKPIPLIKQLFLFTPYEVAKTQKENQDCINPERDDFKEYTSDLEFLSDKTDYLSQLVCDKIKKLLHMLCPYKTHYASNFPSNNIPAVEAQLGHKDDSVPTADVYPIPIARRFGGRNKKSKRRNSRARNLSRRKRR
jgi:hypothetical protein